MARPRNFDFFITLYYGKLGHMLKPLVSNLRPYLLARLKDIAEKQVPAKLNPIVVWGSAALKFG